MQWLLLKSLVLELYHLKNSTTDRQLCRNPASNRWTVTATRTSSPLDFLNFTSNRILGHFKVKFHAPGKWLSYHAMLAWFNSVSWLGWARYGWHSHCTFYRGVPLWAVYYFEPCVYWACVNSWIRYVWNKRLCIATCRYILVEPQQLGSGDFNLNLLLTIQV